MERDGWRMDGMMEPPRKKKARLPLGPLTPFCDPPQSPSLVPTLGWGQGLVQGSVGLQNWGEAIVCRLPPDLAEHPSLPLHRPPKGGQFPSSQHPGLGISLKDI